MPHDDDVQLNVWIKKPYRDQLEQWKQDENKPGMNSIVQELIEAEIARRSGKVVEQQSLPVIQEIVRSEVREATAQLRRELRLDRQHEAQEARDFLLKQVNRMVGLLVMAIRHSSMGFHFLFEHLAQAYGRPFALKTYDEARDKTEQELFPRKHPDLAKAEREQALRKEVKKYQPPEWEEEDEAFLAEMTKQYLDDGE